MNKKILTILISCYNSEKTIENTIKSLDLKNYSNELDVLIIDDGSTDNTYAIIKKLKDKYPTSINILSKANGNYGSVINLARNEINTRFIRTLDADDTLETQNIKTFINELKEMPINVDIIFTNYNFINNENKSKSKNSLTTWFKFTKKTIIVSLNKLKKPISGNISIHSMTFSKDVFLKTKNLPNNIFYSDSFLVFQLLKLSNNISYIPHLYIYNYFISSQEQSINIVNIVKNKNDIDVVIKYILFDGIGKKCSKIKITWLSGVIGMVIKFKFLSLSFDQSLSEKQKQKQIDEMMNLILNKIKNKQALKYIFNLPLKLMFLINIKSVLPIIRFTHRMISTRFIRATRTKQIFIGDVRYSIIIPLYNCENYIEECIESIINSNYDLKQVQIIVVNDGSTDNSLEVLKKFEDKIEIYSKSNGNWGSVINYVKNNVNLTGKYITILDSDDKISPNFFASFEKSENADILISNYNRLFNNKKRKYKTIFGRSRLIKNKDKARTVFCHPHGKLYKKELFLQIFDLPENQSFLDGAVYHFLLNKSESIKYINKELADWRSERPGNSTSEKWSEKKIQQFADHMNYLIDFGSEGSAILFALKPEIRKPLLKYNITFKINKKINFKWVPWIGRPFVSLITKTLLRKLFIIKKADKQSKKKNSKIRL